MPFQNVAAVSARLFVLAAVVSAAAAMSACGADGGVSSHLPAGPPTDEPAGDLVLYAAMNEGDRIDAYRLGEDGLMPSQAFDSIFVPGPRRLAVANGVLYATLDDGIISIELGPEGELPNRPSAHTVSIINYSPVDLEVRDDILYVAAAGVGRVQSFELDEDGNVPVDPTGNGASSVPTDYTSLALNGQFLYSGSRNIQAIDLFILEEDGNVPFAAEPMSPQDRIALPDDIEIRDGILYVTSASDRAIRAYRILPNGFLPGEENSRTKGVEYYSDIMLDGDTLYASAYNEGRIDLYEIDSFGMLPENLPFRSTQDDPASYPAHMMMNDGVLYVAQAGLDRIDAYVLDSNGLPPVYPSSSTPATPDSFPLHVALHSLE